MGPMDESPSEGEPEAGSILAHPEAQALLGDATLTRQAVVGCRGRLTRFLGRYLPRFYRREQREHAGRVVEGLLSGLPRDWAGDPERRQKCHVPAGVAFQEKWRIALDLLDGAGAGAG